MPYVFTEFGVSMLSSVLRGETAAKISIQIIDSFVAMRKFLHENAAIFQRLDMLESKQLETDGKFNQLFDALQQVDLIPKQGIFTMARCLMLTYSIHRGYHKKGILIHHTDR